MNQWLENRGSYLDILLEMQGRPSAPKCSMCSGGHADIRCPDCFGANLFCRSCCLEVHKRSPFHRPLLWTGKHYAPKSLYSLDFLLCLGHNGEPCPETVEVYFSNHNSPLLAEHNIREGRRHEAVGPRRQGHHHSNQCRRMLLKSSNCHHQERLHSQTL